MGSLKLMEVLNGRVLNDRDHYTYTCVLELPKHSPQSIKNSIGHNVHHNITNTYTAIILSTELFIVVNKPDMAPFKIPVGILTLYSVNRTVVRLKNTL